MTLRHGASGEIDLGALGRIMVSAKTVAGEVDVNVRTRDSAALATLQAASGELAKELRNNAINLKDLDIDKEDGEEADQDEDEIDERRERRERRAKKHRHSITDADDKPQPERVRFVL